MQRNYFLLGDQWVTPKGRTPPLHWNTTPKARVSLWPEMLCTEICPLPISSVSTDPQGPGDSGLERERFPLVQRCCRRHPKMLSVKEPCCQLKFMYLLWVEANSGVPGRDIQSFSLPTALTQTFICKMCKPIAYASIKLFFFPLQIAASHAINQIQPPTLFPTAVVKPQLRQFVVKYYSPAFWPV